MSKIASACFSDRLNSAFQNMKNNKQNGYLQLSKSLESLCFMVNRDSVQDKLGKAKYAKNLNTGVNYATMIPCTIMHEVMYIPKYIQYSKLMFVLGF